MIINRYFTGFLISLSFFSCHTQTNKQKINKKQSVQLYVDTSKINIPIQAVSINELKDKLPSNKLSISRTGFIVKVSNDSTYYPVDAPIFFLDITPTKSIFIIQKEGYDNFYWINDDNIFNDSHLTPDSIVVFELGETIFLETYFFNIRSRVEIISIDKNNNFKVSIIPYNQLTYRGYAINYIKDSLIIKEK